MKQWYKSRTIWGTIIGAVLALEPIAVKVATGTAKTEDWARTPFILLTSSLTAYSRAVANGPLAGFDKDNS